MSGKGRYVLAAALLVTVMALGLCFGSVTLSDSELWGALWGNGSAQARVILWRLRLPRVLAGVLAGVGLATAGVLLQTVTANGLAGPGIIGINSGAGLAVIVMLTVMPQAVAVLPLGAFLGAFGAAAVILLVADRLGSSRTVIVLVGIAITTLLNAGISFLSLLDEGVLAQYQFFTVGSLNGVRLEQLQIPAVIIGLACIMAQLLSGKLGALCMGDAVAASLGIRVERLRLVALGCAAACAAAVVSFAGLLGFVGLVVPHMARRLVGDRPVRLLPMAGLLGGIVVLLADLLGRVLFRPSEIPVGILMSLIGAPYFLFLLCRRKSHAAMG